MIKVRLATRTECQCVLTTTILNRLAETNALQRRFCGALRVAFSSVSCRQKLLAIVEAASKRGAP